SVRGGPRGAALHGEPGAFWEGVYPGRLNRNRTVLTIMSTLPPPRCRTGMRQESGRPNNGVGVPGVPATRKSAAMIAERKLMLPADSCRVRSFTAGSFSCSVDANRFHRYNEQVLIHLLSRSIPHAPYF